MASTYTSSLQIQKIGNGEQSGVWGTSTNTNWDLVDNAIAGVINVTMLNADYTLSTANGAYDEARNMVLVVAGSNTASRKVVIPASTKMYMVVNNTTGGYAITIGTSGGAVATVPNGVATMVYCDATNTYAGVTGAAGNFNINGNLTVTGATTETGQLTAAGALIAYTAASFTGSISGTTLSVTALASGTLFVGQILSGSGVTSGTTITGILSAWNGSSGSYTVSSSQTVSSTTITGAASVASINQLVTGNSAIGGSESITGSLTVGSDGNFTGTGQIKLPNGTTGQRSASPTYGMLRYNTTTLKFEGYDGTAGATISSITRITTQATLTTAVNHGLATGTIVVVSGASPTEFNGTYSITVTGDTTFTYTMASTPASNATVVGSYTYGAWGEIGGAAVNGFFYENDTTVTSNYTITSGKNAMSAGPITINSGVTVTVPSGSTWTVV
jgi:hypothetical protein